MSASTNRNVKVININTSGYQNAATSGKQEEKELNSFLEKKYDELSDTDSVADIARLKKESYDDHEGEGSFEASAVERADDSSDSDSEAYHGGTHNNKKHVHGKFKGDIHDESSSSSSDSESDDASDAASDDAASESSTVQLLSEDPLFLVLAQYFATPKGKNIVSVLEDINTNIKNLTFAISKLANKQKS